MSVELIKYAFVAGEISPAYYGRGDLEKFDLGLALARNFIVDYRGGMTTRPGQEFLDFIEEDDKDVRLFEFKFSPDVENTYVILFGHEYIRFVQDGAYVVEDAVVITAATKASPGVVTAVAHGFSNGDWIKISGVGGMTELNGRTFRVAGVTTDTFQLTDPLTSANIDTSAYTTYTSGGNVARIYTVVSPYAASDLANINVTQIRDTFRITSIDFPIYNLTRNDADDWDLDVEVIGVSIARPSAPTLTADSSGNSGTTVAVTAIGGDGSESLPSNIVRITGINSYNNDTGWLKATWPAVADARKYNVYRSKIVNKSGTVTRSSELGYIGSSFGPVFIDDNIAPDYTKAPPVYRNPFANGSITYIAITAGGSGYTEESTVSVSGGGGSGFIGFPIVNGGAIVGVVIVNGGSGYSSVTVTFAVGGTGATATVELSPATGNYPALSAVFQQRQIYASSLNFPLVVWGSQPGRFSDFDESQVLVESDSYEHEIDSEQVAPIRHIIPMRGGLLIFSQTGIWQFRGGDESTPITPIQVIVDPQAFTGVAGLKPLKIDTDILYKEGKGSIIRQLSYNEFSRVYSGKNVSILSSHFFTADNGIVDWSYATDPYSVVWSVREDGALLPFTVVKEQDVYAWTQCWTKGLYKNVLAVQEGTTDAVYFVTERYVNGRWTKFLERQVSREITHVEDAFCVDCGLELGATSPAATLNAPASDGEDVVFTASASVFSAGDVGKILRVGRGKVLITAYNSATEIEGDWLRPACRCTVPEDTSGRLVPAPAGTWTLDAPTTVLRGLWHLEGEAVAVLGDGNVFEGLTVANGQVTLPSPVTRAVVGLAYTCRAKSLPLVARDAIIEGRRKRVLGLAVRLRDTRGLKMGDADDAMYAMKERALEDWGEPTELQQDIHHVLIESAWDEQGQVTFEQTYPLPATILGYVVDVEVGDDPD